MDRMLPRTEKILLIADRLLENYEKGGNHLLIAQKGGPQKGNSQHALSFVTIALLQRLGANYGPREQRRADNCPTCPTLLENKKANPTGGSGDKP